MTKIVQALRPWKRHPIDDVYGIETSRRIFGRFQHSGDPRIDSTKIDHAGAQPSILRWCLDLLPTKDAAFFDIGCGKGRMLAVATEYPFASITGIEIVPKIVRTAVQNAEQLARLYPKRAPVEIIQGDATEPKIPASGTVVLFLYNPFGADQMERLMATIRQSMSKAVKLFVVYYNPVHAVVLDAMPELARLYASLHTFSDDELDSSPFGNNHDSIVIWQSCSEPMLTPSVGADRPVVKLHAAFVGEVQMN